MSKHTDFIQTSIDHLLDDAVSSLRGIPQSIGSYAVCDYIFQALFLRMTGFSEQKAKCICWEMATDDYDYRYDYLKNINKYGEMSDLSSKNKVFNDMVKCQKRINADIDPIAIIDKGKILSDVKNVIKDVFSDTLLMTNNHRHYVEFLANYDDLFKQEYVVKSVNSGYVVFEGVLQEAFNSLYIHRNRCAHNLQSYQQNLPDLRKIAYPKYKYENYYIRFALLLVMDRLFITLFNSHMELVGSRG
ncbi:MAG: hypothetical protein IJ588_02975 [Prevotella sp.]|nr:hypothetical protein [Prevotella sp.]